MSINQKDIFLFVKKYLKKNKNIVDISKSSICYFHNYGEIPGSATLRLKFYGLGYFFKYIKILIKSIILIGFLKNYKTFSRINQNKKFKYLLISHVSINDFNTDGSYNDKYFKINSNKIKNTLFFLNSIDHILPKKLSKNIILFYNQDKLNKFNFYFLIKEFIKLLKTRKNFSIKKFIHEFSFFSVFADLIYTELNKLFIKNNFKKVLSFYEGQPYQNYFFKNIKKKYKIKIIGYYHTSLLPVHSSLYYRDGSPDTLLIAGKYQKKYLINYLSWPSKKVKSIKSLRYKKISKSTFLGNIFLPYSIYSNKKILSALEEYLIKCRDKSLPIYKFKNHPHPSSIKEHIKLIAEIKKLFIKYQFKFSNNIKQENSIFIGSTTSIALAIQLRIKNIIHICEDSKFDSFSGKIWKNLNVTQIGRNIFSYSLKNRANMIEIGTNSKKNYLLYR